MGIPDLKNIILNKKVIGGINRTLKKKRFGGQSGGSGG